MSSEGFAEKVRRPRGAPAASGPAADGATYRYSAFISYNHRDRRQVAWLHRALESYRIPHHLRGRPGPSGPLGARLPPVFRDRDELAASADLAESVRRAIEQSYSLIVVCSPNSARSKWVNEEIRAFAALGRADRIQCLIVGGRPHAASRADATPDEECFPPALFEVGPGRPLASDLRPGQDGALAAKLKLIAGVLGVGYDELRQREQARRNRQLGLLAAASLVGFVLMSGLATFALISRQEAVRQRDIAREKTITAQRTVTFVKSLFEVADPSESRGQTITAREILDRGARELRQGLADEPTVKAELATTLGEVYGGLGLLRQGQDLIRGSLALSGVAPETRARQLVALGEAQWQASDYAAAARSHTQALGLLARARDADAGLVSRARVGLGAAQTQLGEHKAAEANLRAALAADLARVGAAHPDVARDWEALGENAVYAGDLAAAQRDLARGMQIRIKAQGESHPRVIQDLNNLAAVAYLSRDLPTAESYFRRALKGYETILGPDHPEIASALNNLGRILLERRRFAAAAPLLQRAVDVDVAQRDETASDLAFEYANLAIARRGLGQAAEAEALFRKAEAAARRHRHRNLAPILVERAELACAGADPRRGVALLDEAAPIMKAEYADEAWRSAWLEVVRADCLLRTGDRPRAARLIGANAAAVRARWAADSLYGARLAAVLSRAGGV